MFLIALSQKKFTINKQTNLYIHEYINIIFPSRHYSKE
ncbi:protein FAM135 [Bacillus sp. dmp5]|nr:protein FAM135 [Bacillus sp. dmp5]